MTGGGQRILVACIGNIFFGDDAFGVEVFRRLQEDKGALPDFVRLADFGIRGLDLAYALLEPWEAVVLVDAVRRGGAPGTLYVLEPEVDGDGAGVEPHALDPGKVLALARSLGGALPRVRVLGCEVGPAASQEVSPGESDAAGAEVSDDAAAAASNEVSRAVSYEAGHAMSCEVSDEVSDEVSADRSSGLAFGQALSARVAAAVQPATLLVAALVTELAQPAAEARHA